MIAITTTCCSGAGPFSSPSATMKTQYEAWGNKDALKYKETLSKARWNAFSKMFSTCTNCEAKTAEEQLGIIMREPKKHPLEIRNEKVNGDTATLEWKNDQGEWQTLQFVKEDGGWKVN
jgi:hypothetical protein